MKETRVSASDELKMLSAVRFWAGGGRITDVQAAPRRRAVLVEEGSIRWSISCSHARSGDSDNRPTRLMRRAISRRRPAMNFFVHLIARGMLG